MIASLYLAVCDVKVQVMLSRIVARHLTKRLGTEVKIKTLYITTDLHIRGENIQINDLQHNPLFFIGNVDVKLARPNFSKTIHFKNANFDDVFVNIVKYRGDSILNVTDLFKGLFLSNNNDNNFNIVINKFFMTHGHFVFWNQNKYTPEKPNMDYQWLDIDNIQLAIEDFCYKNDTVTSYINHFSAFDKCGFTVDTLKSRKKIMLCSHELILDSMMLKTHATSLDFDLNFKYNDYRDYKYFIDSVYITANIRPSQLTLSDLKYFAYKMEKMPDTLQIQGIISGFVRDFEAKKIKFFYKDNTNFVGTIKVKGLPDISKTYIDAEVDNMSFSYNDLMNFAIPTKGTHIPIPESFSSLKKGSLSGTYKGFYNNFNTEFDINTNLGNVYCSCFFNNDRDMTKKGKYKILINTDKLDLKNILGLNDDFVIDMSTKIEGEGLTKRDADLEIAADIDHLECFKNVFNNLNIKCDLENQHFIVSSKINTDKIYANINGMIDISHEIPSYDISAFIQDADLYGLHLLDNDKTMLFSTKLRAIFNGNRLDNLYGMINLDSTSYYDSRGYYPMKRFHASITENQFDSKDISVSCDFFDMNARGIINFKTIGNSFKNYVLNYFHVPAWSQRGIKLPDNIQDFYLDLNLKNTETLSRLFMPSLHISENTNYTATFTSNGYLLNSALESKQVCYKGIKFIDLNIENKTFNQNATADVSLKEIVLRDSTEKNPDKLSLENLNFTFNMQNDSILFNLVWDDDSEDDRNKGNLKACYVSGDEYGGRINITSSDVKVNDSSWYISPTCYIDFQKDKTLINEFEIYSGNQSVNLKGCYPKYKNDTISVKFRNLDISDFDLITVGRGIDMDGFINGDFQLSGISDNLTFLSNLNISDIKINKQVVGDADIDAVWNVPDTSILIDAKMFGIINNRKDRTLSLLGSYYPLRENNNLNFNIDVNNIDISFINPFTKNFISRIKGCLGGKLAITGSFKKPVIDGRVKLVKAGCRINYLNTYYEINKNVDFCGDLLDHYIDFSDNRIDFKNIVFTDSLNNQALGTGIITHDYFKNFNFDVNISMDNFLAFDRKSNNKSFYGTVIADGKVGIKGLLSNIEIDIDVKSMPGTVIDVPLSGTTKINDNFVIFVNKEEKQDTIQRIIPDNSNGKNNLALNFDVKLTPDAKVNIYLPNNTGSIKAKGTGNLNLKLSSDELSLLGDYFIEGGSFTFVLRNLVRRNFDLRSGGSISWTGSPFNADIDIIGSYRTKSSISSLGIETDSTSFANNINVDCIIHLKDKLMNPNIIFGIELPNSSDDIKNTVFSVIDTTNQAVMSQQIISLLVLGAFSYTAGENTLSRLGTNTYYSVITNSLSNWLSQMSKDFDVDLRYTPNDNLTNEEIEVALSTRLFNDRLTIEGNFGMFTGSKNEINQSANNIVGDLDLLYKITDRLSFKAYNHSNINSNYYNYSYDAYSDYTQGIGISYFQNFDRIKEIFTRKNKTKKSKRK